MKFSNAIIDATLDTFTIFPLDSIKCGMANWVIWNGARKFVAIIAAE